MLSQAGTLAGAAAVGAALGPLLVLAARRLTRTPPWPAWPWMALACLLGSFCLAAPLGSRGAGLAALVQATLLAALAVGALADLRAGIIPDAVNYPAVALALAAAPLLPSGGWPTAALGALVCAGVTAALAWSFLWLRGQPGLGWGDVKLMAVLGAALGPVDALAAVFLAALTALAAVGLWAVFKGWRAGRRLAFGPYLALWGGLLLVLAPRHRPWLEPVLGCC